jgi:hypothetical protein
LRNPGRQCLAEPTLYHKFNVQDQNRFLGTGRARRPWHDQSRPELEARGLVYILAVCERTHKLVRELVLDPGPLKMGEEDARFDGSSCCAPIPTSPRN